MSIRGIISSVRAMIKTWSRGLICSSACGIIVEIPRAIATTLKLYSACSAESSLGVLNSRGESSLIRMASTRIFPSPTGVRSLQDARCTSRKISCATSSSGWTIKSIFRSSCDNILPSTKSIERALTILRSIPNLSAINEASILVESSLVVAIISSISSA